VSAEKGANEPQGAFRSLRLFARGALSAGGGDAEYATEYRLELAQRTLRLGRIASLLGVVFLPLFILQDIFVLKMRILPWRITGYAAMVMFAGASFSVLRRRPRIVVECYAVTLLCFMLMMSGIVLTIFSDPASTIAHAYLVIDSLVVSMMLVFLFSAGARRYIAAILFVPLAALVVCLALGVGLPLDRLSAFSNPAAVAIALIAMSAFQERLAFKEFKMRKLAAAREMEKSRAEDRARENRLILQSFLDSVSERAFVMDKTGVIVFANQAFAGDIGRDLDSIIGQDCSAFMPADFQARYKGIYAEVLASKEPLRIETEENGLVFENTIYPVRDCEGSIDYIGVLAKDITERKDNERRLEYVAIHDALTGLYNRRFLIESLKQAIAQAKRGDSASLIYADLDDFKAVNDKKGHEAGDVVLREVAGILFASIRARDAAFRIGGDEFAILFRDMRLEAALQIARRVGAAVRERQFVFDGEVFSVGMSIGVTEIDGDRGADDVLTCADAAMYRAKKGGKNRVES
jgi:diguanylate cyclase (GGDEF)-like protein/PAS domain S-box-containing protein